MMITGTATRSSTELGTTSERRHYVANTRWWPPFCAAVDWLVAVVLAIEIIAGAGFHH
jgi:hypothetical protein